MRRISFFRACTKLAPILAGTCLVTALPASGQTLREDLWAANGQVRSIIQTPDAIYLGGLFTQVGPVTGSAVAVDLTTGATLAPFPKVSGTVNAAVPDGNGGWYIGGSFTAVGGQPRYGLAQVDSGGALSPWGPELVNPGEQVRCLSLSGSTLYVGGTFTNLGGLSRTHLAAVDVPSGAVTAWNPAPNQPVYSLAVVFGTVYAGGQFTQIGTASRNLVAALDPGTGVATAWNPNVTGTIVRTIGARVVVFPSTTVTIYIGGAFTLVGGQGRSNVASLDATGGGTGTVNAWNPGVNGTVLAMNVNGSNLIVGGTFTVAAGAARRNLASINGSGAASSWDPSPDETVYALARNGITLYAGGDFTSVGGQPRRNIAALDLAGGTTTAWDPKAGGRVNALAVFGTAILAGGEFTIMGGVDRTFLASLDPVTGEATGWNPYLDGPVHVLEIHGNTLYVGGFFFSASAGARPRLAAFDLTTGLVTSWNPQADNDVYALAATDSVVYVGGWFNNIGGALRHGVAAIDAQTGLATAWDANLAPFTICYSLAMGPSTLYAGLAASAVGLDLASAQAVWNANANGTVFAVRVSGDELYVGGSFSLAGGQPRNGAASFDASSGLVTGWNPDAAKGLSLGEIYTFAFDSGVVYAGGTFDTIGGQSRRNLAALDPLTGAAQAWNPGPDTWVQCLHMTGGSLLVGGEFTDVSMLPQGDLAAFTVGTVGVRDMPRAALRVPVTASPNPSRGPAYLRFSLAAGDEIKVTVIDPAGRLVRQVWSGPLPAGEHQVTWDGRDEAGSPVSRGVYFARVHSRAATGNTKIIRLR